MAYSNMASVYNNMEKYPKALSLYERGLQIGKPFSSSIIPREFR